MWNLIPFILKDYAMIVKIGVLKMKQLIKVENLNFKSDNNHILKDINFDIYKKDFVGIIGPNGAGKSSLIKCILGELEYTGKITINGKVGYIPQHDDFEKDFPITGSEVVLMGLYKNKKILKGFDDLDKKKVKELLNLLDIEYVFDRQVGKLSGGEYQRLMLARAVIFDPDILVLDEPEAGIDKKGQELFYKVLERLQTEKNMTIILVSHDLSMVFKKTNRVMCLNKTLHCHKSTKEMTAEDLKILYPDSLEMLVHVENKVKVVDRND
jgi:zinc transport system ATP-binding protein